MQYRPSRLGIGRRPTQLTKSCAATTSRRAYPQATCYGMRWNSQCRTCANVQWKAGSFRVNHAGLGSVDAEVLASWMPDRPTTWYKAIAIGQVLDRTEPMLLRPPVSRQAPARWYVEDGSGRAIAFVKYQHLFLTTQTLAIGYLGRVPDLHSSFMQLKLPELVSGDAPA